MVLNDEECFAAVARGGDVAIDALKSLYIRYYRRFRGHLERRGFSSQDAEDIVHDLFIKLARLRGRQLFAKRPGPYLWRALINCASDKIRSRSPAISESDLHGDAGSIDLLTAIASDREDLDFLRCFQQALQSFSAHNPDAAVAIELTVIEGYSGKELADVLQRSYGATREFLSQCRKHFAALLRELCGDYLPESLRGA